VKNRRPGRGHNGGLPESLSASHQKICAVRACLALLLPPAAPGLQPTVQSKYEPTRGSNSKVQPRISRLHARQSLPFLSPLLVCPAIPGYSAYFSTLTVPHVSPTYLGVRTVLKVSWRAGDPRPLQGASAKRPPHTCYPCKAMRNLAVVTCHSTMGLVYAMTPKRKAVLRRVVVPAPQAKLAAVLISLGRDFVGVPARGCTLHISSSADGLQYRKATWLLHQGCATSCYRMH
jgi:hypothetical protein